MKWCLCQSPMAWCIFLCRFSPRLSNCFSMLPIFGRCCQGPFHPNHAWLDTNLEEALFLAREMSMPTQEDHIFNLYQKACLALWLADLSNQFWTLLHHSQHPRKSPMLFQLEDYQLIFFYLGFTPCKAEHPLRGIKLQEKKGKKRLQHTKNLFRKNLQLKDVC